MLRRDAAAAGENDTVTRAWFLRPIAWFAAASMGTTVLHELAHASAAYILGVRSTLFNYSAQLDLTPAQAATNLPALIRLAGPGVCLVLGAVCWLVGRRRRGSAADLPLLYLTVFGVGTFVGNLMSATFVGDFSSVAIALDLPMPVRYAISIAGALGVAALHFWAGRQLVRWTPTSVGRVAGMFGIIAVPVVVGTVVVLLVNWPMPASSVSARAAEASFWLFAAIGALVAGRDSGRPPAHFRLHGADGAIMLAAVFVVRLLVRGIPFVP